MLQTISHPTDFSLAGQTAFLNALKLALSSRSRLDLLHVHSPHSDDRWDSFPKVREVLERWGALPPGALVDDIAPRTGMSVNKIEISNPDPITGLSDFLIGHRPDLLVMASQRREGFSRWLTESVSTQVAHEASVPSLMFGPAARSFVDTQSGALSLEKVLVPVAHHPAPGGVLRVLAALTEGLRIEIDLIHVGDAPPEVRDAAGAPVPVRCVKGPVVETILAAAADAQMIAMPTAGHLGFLDALRGSTTEQVVRRAPCPVLALPERA